MDSFTLSPLLSFTNFSKILRTCNPFSVSVNNVDLKRKKGKKEERKERNRRAKGRIRIRRIATSFASKTHYRISSVRSQYFAPFSRRSFFL